METIPQGRNDKRKYEQKDKRNSRTAPHKDVFLVKNTGNIVMQTWRKQKGPLGTHNRHEDTRNSDRSMDEQTW